MNATQIESKIAHYQTLHQQTAAHLLKLEGAISGLRELLDEERAAEKQAAAADEPEDTEAPL